MRSILARISIAPSRARAVIVFAALAPLVLVACEKSARQPRENGATADHADGALPVLWPVPTFAFPDQDGRVVSRADLAGHPWVADFIYTRCTSACPILSARTVALQRQIPDPRVRFVSFSVDPEHDTAAALKDYVRRWRGDESRWRLLRPDPPALRALAAALKMTVMATGEASEPVVHSNRFTLVDGEGRVRGIYDSTDDDAMKKLAGDLRTLAGAAAEAATAPATADAASGARIYAALGCAGCHAAPTTGPPLAGLRGSTVTLTDGRSLRADDAYLRESIVDPNAKVVAGYGATMPSYAWLGDAERAALVAYLGSLGGTAAAAPERRLVTDPVCHMQLSAGADTPTIRHGDETYYFCSTACRDRFAREPSRYARVSRASPLP